MSARSRRPAAEPAEPLRVFAIVNTSGALAQSISGHPIVWRDRPEDSVVTTGFRVVEFIEVRQPPPRDTAWGEGQFDHVQVGPGVTIALRITTDGRVKMLSPGGEIDVTDGSSSLGTGLHEAGRRAAQIRVRRVESARRRAERSAKP